MAAVVLEHQADGTPLPEHLDNIMPLNFGILQPVDIGARFMAGQEEAQRNQLAQQQRAQDQELNALRMQQTRGAISQQERQLKAETAAQKTEMFRQRLLRARDPNSARELVKMQYADPDVGAVLSQAGSLEQALAEVPDDPVLFERYRQQEALGMSEWIKSQMPKVVGGSIYNPAKGTFETPPKETISQESLLMQQLGYPLTPQGYQDFINAKKPSTLRTKEEEEQSIRIARASRPPAQPAPLQPLVAVKGPNGQTIYVSREEALKNRMSPPDSSGGTTSESERKAATLLQRLQFSQNQLTQALTDDPKAAGPEAFAAAVGKFSTTASNLLNSQARQRVEAAQLDILDAALTLGTGAAYTREQLEGYRQAYFPAYGDEPQTILDKQARLQNVIEAAQIAAGKAGKLVPAQTPVAPAFGGSDVRSKADQILKRKP